METELETASGVELREAGFTLLWLVALIRSERFGNAMDLSLLFFILWGLAWLVIRYLQAGSGNVA